MEIGNIVWREDFGVGKIIDTDYSCLVYFYKENKILHKGYAGPDNHYWWCFRDTLTLIHPTLRVLIERRRHG